MYTIHNAYIGELENTMKLTSSYTCNELFYKDQNDVLATGSLNKNKNINNCQDRSLTSSGSSTSSSYSNNSMTSDFCISSPNSSGSCTGSNDTTSPEKVCANFDGLNLKNNSADQQGPEQKKQLQEQIAVGNSQPQTTSYSSISPIESSSYLKLYKIQEKIRSGGFGVVFKGQRRIDNLPIAIKFIRKDKINLWFDVSGVFY